MSKSSMPASMPEMRSALRRREVSALELARHALARLDTEGRRLSAVAQVVPELAERDARAADRRLRRGERGALLGIPYGVKDLVSARGTRTTWGAEPYADREIDEDAHVVERLRAAGAVLVAKLAMVALAGAGAYRSPAASLQGATRNPWALDRWAGGSSSGPGAAVAAGLVPFALGSETTGSIVIPASFCGVSGLRPSFGLVSRHGVMPCSWSFDKLGPMARSAAECRDVLEATAGPDERDPATLAAPPAVRRPWPPRLGVIGVDPAVYPDTARVFSRAVAALRTLGARTRRLPPFPIADLRRVGATIFDGEASAAHRDLIASRDLDRLSDATQRERLRAAGEIRASAYVLAQTERAAMAGAILRTFDEIDVLVTPTVPVEAPPIDLDLDGWRRHPHHGILGAIAGLPGISVPMGVGGEGLPLGIAIMGPPGSDRLVLRAAAELQRVTEWHLARPGESA